MNKIKVLDDLTIQKIAAGEVIEEPASIVKELIENSIDANAKNIVVEIKEGGKTYIRVTDDGDGIRESDLDLAFEQHSTSKLSKVEDLYAINSLGFRGEALSSISNVAKVEVLTKTSDALGGIQAMVEEGKIISKDLVGCPKGTTMIVRDLFYNLPVRKEFLKTDRIESNSISDVVYKASLGNPQCSFRFINDNKTTLTTSRSVNFKNHIYSILGKEFSNNMVQVEEDNELLNIDGYIGTNQLYRGNRSHQYLYINGRYIKNMDIAKRIENIYKTLIPINRFPVFLLFIDIDPTMIDVNIHPTKQEIKFSNMDRVLDIITRVVEDALRKSIAIPKASISRKKEKKVEELPLLFDMEKEVKEDIGKTEDIDGDETILIKDLRFEDQPGIDRINEKIEIGYDLEDEVDYESLNDSGIYCEDEVDIEIEETLENLEPIGVIFETYILAEDRVNEKFYFIDQHSSHERVMYERFLKEYREEKIAVQQLFAPKILDLTEKETNDVKDNLELFQRLGFDVEIFGVNSVIIRGIPIIFGSSNIQNLFMDVLDNLDSNISSNYDLRVEKIMKIACVNSVKSGDTMAEKEILALFDQLKECENPFTCPHGRPTMLEMSKKDIEKEFLRIM